MTKVTKSSYPSPDAAALGGFKRILRNYSRWTELEYGFFVIEMGRELRRYGHEAFVVSRYHYTEPETNGAKGAISLTPPKSLLPFIRAFCHTHPTGSGFSTNDFAMFKSMKKMTKANNLTEDVVFYLMNTNWQVRRSRTEVEKDFLQGEVIKGLEQASP